jgi:predicted RNA-binding protein YlqC (UPF0109 family)
MPMETYLVDLIRPLLTKPDSVTVVTSHDDMGVLLTLTVAQEDMGTVVGKGGETAKAVRHLIRIAGVKGNARVSVKINEPDGSPYRPRPTRDFGAVVDDYTR